MYAGCSRPLENSVSPVGSLAHCWSRIGTVVGASALAIAHTAHPACRPDGGGRGDPRGGAAQPRSGHPQSRPAAPAVGGRCSLRAGRNANKELGRVDDLIRVGRTVYIGGNFTVDRRTTPAATATRLHLAAVRAGTGKLRRGSIPPINGRVYALAVSPDGRFLFVGGQFTAVGSAPAPQSGGVQPAHRAAVEAAPRPRHQRHRARRGGVARPGACTSAAASAAGSRPGAGEPGQARSCAAAATRSTAAGAPRRTARCATSSSRPECRRA